MLTTCTEKWPAHKKIQTDTESFKFCMTAKQNPLVQTGFGQQNPRGEDLQAEQNKMTSHYSKTGPRVSLLNHYIELHTFFFFGIYFIDSSHAVVLWNNKMQYRTDLWYTERWWTLKTLLSSLSRDSRALHCIESQQSALTQTSLMLTLTCFCAHLRSHNNICIGS